MIGVEGEERENLSKEESRAIRKRSLKLLGALIKPMRGKLVVAVLVVIVSQLAQVIGPALIAKGIDLGVPALQQGDWQPLIVVGSMYFAAAILGGSLAAWYVVITARISQAVLYDLRQRVFHQTQRLSLEFHETYTSGRIISRQTSDLDAIRELLDSGINGLTTGLLYMGFTAVTMVLLDWKSGLILAVSLIPLLILTRWFQIRSQELFRKSRVVSANLIVHFVEAMAGIRAVQAFRKEKSNRKVYGKLTGEYRDVNTDLIQIFGIYDPGLVLIGNMTVAATLLFGGFRLFEGDIEIGVLLAVILYARRFFDPMEEMAMFYNSYQSAAAALEKISGVLEESPTVPDPKNPESLWDASGELVFDGVEFAYTPEHVVLPKFDLTIPAGETIALVGTTGAGKTTLAKLISRFYDPSEGELRLDGISLDRLHPKDLRRAIVMVTQEAYLFSGTIAENIELGKPGATPDEIERAAKAIGAHDFIMKMPDGYQTSINARGARVSAGQRQLISFARAFLANPAVLILDEATASLDIPSERLVQNALQTLLAGRTAIIIAHRLSTVAIADRILVMEHGRIIEDGTPDDLSKRGGKFASLHQAWQDSLV